MATIPTQIRIDVVVKEKATVLFSNLGMDLSSAVNVFLRQCILQGGLPFKVEIPRYNQETLEAMPEARRISRDPNVRGHSSLDGLMAETRIVPLIPLRELVLFPNTTVPLLVGRDKTRNAVIEACSKDNLAMFAAQKDKDQGDPSSSDIYGIGVLAKIENVRCFEDNGPLWIVVSGICRSRIIRYIDNERMLQVEAEEIIPTAEGNLDELVTSALKSFDSYVLKHPKRKDVEAFMSLKDIKDPNAFIGGLAKCFDIKLGDQQRILEINDLSLSLKELMKFIPSELETNS